MKIFKSKYGWSTTAHSKNQDGSKNTVYVEVGFPKSFQPNGEEMEGELVFKTNGQEYPCFLSSYLKKDGSTPVKLVVMGHTKYEQTSLSGDNRDVTGHTIVGNTWKDDSKVEIDTDELPFY